MKTIHHVVDIDAPADRVWSALTDLTDLAGWWSTKVEEVGGSGVGSRLNWTFAGDFNPVMEVTAIKDGTEVDWLCVSGHEPWQDGQFRFQIADTGDGRTRLRITHAGWDAQGLPHRDGFDSGWHDKLTKDLAALLGT